MKEKGKNSLKRSRPTCSKFYNFNTNTCSKTSINDKPKDLYQNCSGPFRGCFPVLYLVFLVWTLWFFIVAVYQPQL